MLTRLIHVEFYTRCALCGAEAAHSVWSLNTNAYEWRSPNKTVNVQCQQCQVHGEARIYDVKLTDSGIRI